MKRFVLTALIFACLLCSGCGAKEQGRVPLEELPEDYSLEQAKTDGCVVHEDGDISAGQEVFEAFVSDCAKGKSGSVRIYSYYTLDPERCAPEYYEAEKDNYPWAYIQDLSFDGGKYTIHWLEDGQEYVREYEYLLRCEGEAESKTALYSSYVRYLLAHDESVAWEKYFYGMVSSRFGDAIDAYEVYSDIIY